MNAWFHNVKIWIFGLNRGLILYFFAILISSPMEGRSQEQVIEQLKTETKYRLTGTGLFSWGNRNRQFAISEGEFDRIGEKLRFNFLPSMIYNRVNGRVTEYDYYVKGLLAWNPRKKIQPFLVSIYEYSERRQVDFRTILGPGISFTTMQRPNHKLYLQFAMLYDYTDYNGTDFRILGPQESNLRRIIRPSPRVVGEHFFKNRDIRIEYIYWFHSGLQRINDTRMKLDLNIDYKITEWLSFRTALDYFFENIVLQGLNSNDLLLSFGINIHNKKL
ncbi:MAG: DUF481 domain-containing protein [Bacteroidota bacterium]